jgi:hypothetical protein
MRRVPFGSEAGAFRFTLGAGLVIGASVFIGWLSAPAAGLAVFAAATVSAALSCLYVALRDRQATSRRAMSEAALDRARPQAGHHGGAEPWRLDGCRRRVPHGQIGVISEFAQGVTVGCGRCEWATGHVLSRGFSFRIAPF